MCRNTAARGQPQIMLTRYAISSLVRETWQGKLGEGSLTRRAWRGKLKRGKLERRALARVAWPRKLDKGSSGEGSLVGEPDEGSLVREARQGKMERRLFTVT